MRRDAAVRADLDHAAGRPGRLDHRPAFADRVADRLLDVDVGPGLHRGDRLQRVPVVGRGDDDDLGLLLVEQLADSRRTSSAWRRSSFSTSAAAGSSKRRSTSHRATTFDCPAAIASRRMFMPHQPRADQGRLVDLVFPGRNDRRGGDREPCRRGGRQKTTSGESHASSPPVGFGRQPLKMTRDGATVKPVRREGEAPAEPRLPVVGQPKRGSAGASPSRAFPMFTICICRTRKQRPATAICFAFWPPGTICSVTDTCAGPFLRQFSRWTFFMGDAPATPTAPVAR